MAKPDIGRVAASVMDPMMSDNFLLEITNIPGASAAGAANALIMQCKSVSKPGVTINNVEVMVFGHVLEYVGQKTFSHDLQVEYYENRNAVIQKALEDWAEYCRRTQDQLGNYKGGGEDGYARNAKITVYDVKGTEIAIYEVKNIWPATVPDVPFAGDQVSAITLSVGFKYDYYTRK